MKEKKVSSRVLKSKKVKLVQDNLSQQEHLLLQVVLPSTISQVKISESRREVFYNTKKHTIPKKYLKEIVKEDGIYKERVDGFIIDKEGNRILKNIRTAGKPRYLVINFQSIWNGSVGGFSRNNMKLKLEASILAHLGNIPPIDPSNFPVKVELFIYTLKNEVNIDTDNSGPIFHKIFNDILRGGSKGNLTKIIPDDTVKYINDAGRTKYIIVDKPEDKKYVFRVSKSDNLC